MKNKTDSFALTDSEAFKIKMLSWSRRFNIFCFLDNNNYAFEIPAFECLMAAGCNESISLNEEDNFDLIKTFSKNHPGWLFGHLGYPAPVPKRYTAVSEGIGFEKAFFFIPEVILKIKNGQLFIESDGKLPVQIFDEINAENDIILNSCSTHIDIKDRYSKEAYIQIIEALLQHIHRGDCYEINFCQDFFSHNASIDPYFLFKELNAVSPNPFAAFYKLNEKYCLCASPERFIKRSGNTIISQPIKGTSKRNLLQPAADLENKEYLINSVKERSENVMVVDLVRNDLSRISMEGSVKVKELCGIYSFPQVHQMISTIEATVEESMHWTDILEACFPMGSMTGAPKKRVMQLVDEFEIVPRGLFSGTIGYIDPDGNFDFNVVIRSLFYNKEAGLLSFKAGSGITSRSNALEEYEECMMKAAAIRKILGKK